MKGTIGIIGWGKMGSSLGEALYKANFTVYSYDKDEGKLKQAENISIIKTSSSELIKSVSTLILAIKPQDVKEWLKEAKNSLLEKKPLLITIVAGVSTNFFERILRNIRIVRVMPNLAVKVKESVSFLCKGKFSEDSDLEMAQKIFTIVGKTFIVQEEMMDKVTSISGSGPGYIYYFMDCMFKGALHLGFDPAIAEEMVKQTLWGAAKLARISGETFSKLTEEVTSPKGTTEEALKVFEKSQLEEILYKAITAAHKRAQELNLK